MKVLVIFHVFYENLVGYYLDKMRNIDSCQWDLVVTGPCISQETRERILEVNHAATFIQCDNVGYDVWPFIAGMRSVDAESYDLVIKLHTKNEDGEKFRLHGEVMTGSSWRAYMVDALLKDKETFLKLVETFRKRPSLGIAYSQKLNFKSKRGHPEDGKMLKDELERLGIERKSSDFCAGTMFAARPSALEFLKRPDINAGIFQHSGPSHGCASMAHVYERLIPIAIVSNGYGLKLIPASAASAVLFAVKNTIGPAIQWLASVDYYGDNHQKCLKLFGHVFEINNHRA